MPLNIDFLQVLLHMLNFVILAGGLSLLLFRPVNRFLTERRERLEKQAQENEAKARENEALKAEYEQKKAEVAAEMDAMRKKTEKETVRIAKEYMDEAKEKADAIVAAAEKLLGDTVTPERNSALYDEFIRRADQSVTDKRGSE